MLQISEQFPDLNDLSAAPPISVLFIMRPHAYDFNCFYFIKNLIDKSVLYIYAPGKCAIQITGQFLKRRIVLVRIFF